MGPDNILWLPTGFMRTERSGPHEGVGLRMTTFLCGEPDALLSLQALQSDLLNMSKRNAAIDLAISTIQNYQGDQKQKSEQKQKAIEAAAAKKP